MKAAFKKGTEVYLREARLGEMKPDLVRVRVEACGVCGTDLHLDAADTAEHGFGHEVAGEILEVGSAVPWLKPGQKVVLDSSTPCGRCANCRNAEQELCTNLQSFWFTQTFGFAEEMLAPGFCAFPYEGLSPEVACLQEPLGVAIDLVRVADIRPGSNVLLTGLGPIGLMALSLVKQAGAARVFVSDFKDRAGRVSVAERIGVDAVIDPRETPVTDFKFGCRIDRVLVTAPPKTLAAAFQVAAKGAIVAFIGIEYGDGALCTFDANAFHFKKLQLRASFASPALFGPKAVDLLRQGVVDGEAIVSHRFPLDRVADAIQTARRDPAAVKVVVMP